MRLARQARGCKPVLAEELERGHRTRRLFRSNLTINYKLLFAREISHFVLVIGESVSLFREISHFVLVDLGH